VVGVGKDVVLADRSEANANAAAEVMANAGDTVWIEPGERHWHGASPTTAMTHIAIAEMLDGKAVEWMEQVTGEQYGT
jgi:quercetin dioxygenase-like cupin family protein